MQGRRHRWKGRRMRGTRPPTLHDVGVLLITFVFLASIASLAWDVFVPLSVTGNRWLVAVLALGCLLMQL